MNPYGRQLLFGYHTTGLKNIYNFVLTPYLKLLFILQVIEYFRDQFCLSLMGTDIVVLINETNKNHQYKHFRFYNALQNMYPSVDILRQSLRTLAFD